MTALGQNLAKQPGTCYVVGLKEGVKCSFDGFVQARHFGSLSLIQHGHHEILDTGKERSTTHDKTAGPGARGGWMSTRLGSCQIPRVEYD